MDCLSTTIAWSASSRGPKPPTIPRARQKSWNACRLEPDNPAQEAASTAPACGNRIGSLFHRLAWSWNRKKCSSKYHLDKKAIAIDKLLPITMRVANGSNEL